MKRICIGLVGDFSEKIHTHVALNHSLEHCRPHLPFRFDAQWIATPSLNETGLAENKFHGCWIVPGSPYLNDEGVLNTIKWAREHEFPLLGSCGGFQYMVLEYARNVLGMADAAHEESDPHSGTHIISKLSCSLKGRQEEVFIKDRQSWLYRVLNREKITGHFYCSYGFNASYHKIFEESRLSFTAFSGDGEVRAFGLKTHPFFNGTLFQPSLESSSENPNPLILDFIRRCARQ
jgi:CTP synthase (UTP-ammonia lyase)